MLNFLSVKKHLKALRAQGGIQNHYNKLIQEISGLSEDYDQKFSLEKMEVKEGVYSILIEFKGREGFAIAYQDIFILDARHKKLKIIWYRNLIASLYFKFPKKIKKKFNFDKTLPQKKIFELLLQSITSELSTKYDFDDTHYRSVLENGNYRYVSPEEQRKLESQAFDAMIDHQQKMREAEDEAFLEERIAEHKALEDWKKNNSI